MENNFSEEYFNPGPLPSGISLRVYDPAGTVIFESSGKWLHPLFELEMFLQAGRYKVSGLFLHDKIAGRAAASLITRMGFRRCRIETVSRLALEVFRRHKVDCRWTTQVDMISCRTEALLTDDMDMESIYLMLKERAENSGKGNI